MLLQFDHHTGTLQECWEAHTWPVKLKTLVPAKSWLYHSLSLQISCMHWPCLTITVTDKKDLLPRKPLFSHKTNLLGMCTWEDNLHCIHQPKWHTTHRVSECSQWPSYQSSLPIPWSFTRWNSILWVLRCRCGWDKMPVLLQRQIYFRV